jgi:hypothetical protein
MAEYSLPEQGASFPPEWFDLTKMYEVTGPYIQEGWNRTPQAIEAEVNIWQDQAHALGYANYRTFMRGRFQDLARSGIPALPVLLCIGWANGTPANLPAIVMLRLWLGELFSLLYPEDALEELVTRTNNALINSRPPVWDGALALGRQLWPERSGKQVTERLNNWLADYVASYVWGITWLRLKIWPQTARTAPYAHEKKSQDSMEAWNTMSPEDAVKCAQLERIFGEKARQLPGYNPEHPLANMVKRESPKLPAPGAKAFLLIATILPLVIYHHWSLADIARCLVIARSDLAVQFQLDDPGKRAEACRYIRRQLLKPMGIKLPSHAGRPVGSSDSHPKAFNCAILCALTPHLQAVP